AWMIWCPRHRSKSAAAFINTYQSGHAHLFNRRDDYHLFLNALRTAGRVVGLETEFTSSRGMPVYVSINALLKRHEGAETIEVFVKDISERKNVEIALRSLNEELESRVTARTKELTALNEQLWREIKEREQIQLALREAKEEAEQANQSKDRYLAAASHDLLQPMNAARLLVSALRERPFAGEDAHLIERVHTSLDNAEGLLSDLLEISRLDQNAVAPEFGHYSLQSIIEPLISEFQAVAQKTGVTLKVLPTSACVKTDARLLVRILRNLLSNALRYTEEGKILVGVRRQKESIRLCVHDTGIGIPQTKLADVFKEFHQLLPKHSSRGGVGLGLAIVDRIAKMLEHPLQVRSVEGKGSVFSIELPCVVLPHAQAVTPSLSVISQASLEQARILVIDNEPSILVSMEALLTQWGCEVLTASDGDEAIALCQDDDFYPQIILADYHLDNNKTGVQAIERLHQCFNDDIPAVLITAERSEESSQLFRSLGFTVLNKPVRPGRLRAALSHHLRKA
ncbi:MAG: hybrid sensor histidine kinase/response regulator, partial [Pontibacterium sp.]